MRWASWVQVSLPRAIVDPALVFSSFNTITHQVLSSYFVTFMCWAFLLLRHGSWAGLVYFCCHDHKPGLVVFLWHDGWDLSMIMKHGIRNTNYCTHYSHDYSTLPSIATSGVQYLLYFFIFQVLYSKPVLFLQNRSVRCFRFLLQDKERNENERFEHTE